MEKNEQKTTMVKKPEKKTEVEMQKNQISKEEVSQTDTALQPTSVTESEKKEEKLKAEKKTLQEKKKKTEAIVMAQNIPISTKHSAAICRFIKNKKIDSAISDLEAVLKFKKVVPMRGEIPHRHGKGMMSGRFPKKASENFIKLLKSLKANSNYNGLENPIIIGAVANIGERPFGRFGAVRKKRTHIKLVAKDITEKKPKPITNVNK
ncbi:hypothetical protein J4422_01105 [Candidatus Pacearchaeota archaeon]|nr:hypothetical protein [uncultured archaeon]MBS3086279.1 hypothetical protein [Candidatus Pacearchaeota archaeon]